MTSTQFKMFRTLFVGLVVALDVLPISAADVVLQTVVAPQSTVVRLGDVAKVRSEDKRESERLSAIPLLPAPAPGRRRFLRMREVQDLLAAHGEDLKSLNFSGELMVEIAPPVVKNPAVPVNSDRRAVWAGTSTVVPANMTANPEAVAARPLNETRLTDAEAKEAQNYVERAVIEHLNRNSGRKTEWQLAMQIAPADLARVLGAKSALKCSGGVAPWTGPQNFVVAFSTERGPVRVRCVADVTLSQTVVVATHTIERGQVITAADVAVRQVDGVPQETTRRKLVDSLDSVIGMEATRAIQEGDAVYSDDYRPQLLIKRGEEIVVYARGGGIQVRTIARAKQDGARGELINVESLEEKEPFEAVVTGPREAVVFTATATTPEKEVADTPFRRMRQK